MWAHCGGSVWQGDDLSRCIQQKYLQTIFPLLACALSLLILVINKSVLLWRRKNASKKQYRRLAEVEVEGEEIDSLDEHDSVADLALQNSTSHAAQSNTIISKPTGELTLVVVELLTVLGQLVIGVVTLVASHRPTHKLHSWRKAVLVAPIAVWGYVAILVGLRLFRAVTKWQGSLFRLWNHTATLYGWLWLTEVFVFRSALIHPPAVFVRNLLVVRFVLTTLLAVIALVSRRGNRDVVLEYEGELTPSKEPMASVLSLLSFSWVDAIVWKGFKKTLELEDVWNVAVKDKAQTVLANFRQIKKTHKLAVRLIIHFKGQLLVQGLWCMAASVFMFVPTMLLKAILEYLENPGDIPKSSAWLYVILLFITGIIQAVGDGQGLWIGRRICIQIRGVIIGEIYSKVLRRKAAASTEAEKGHIPKLPESVTLWARLKSWGRKKPTGTFNESDAVQAPKALDTQATNGTVINLMSIDSFKVSEACSYLHFLWAAVPVQLIMAVSLLYNVLGLSSLAGIGLMVLVLPLNLYIAKSFTRAQKRIMAATDSRIHVTNEVLNNIRIIKYFAWEQRFASNVNEKRQAELNALWGKYILWSSAATIWSGIPVVITFASFFIFTIVEKRELVPSVAFPALSMFSLLRIPLDQLADMVAHVQESKVSVDRVEEFLGEEETEKYQQMKTTRELAPRETRIALDNATLTWGSKGGDDTKDTASAFRLINMNVEFVIGKLNVIAGATGSGKTSLLMALLGEMKLLNGNVSIPGGYSRQDLRPDPVTGLTESVAYCAQQAWLVNDTIKENILFASPYDHQRYKAVISACALSRDLEILDAGDQTLVGEKGITLSGGQKQRVSLARALYSKSKHLLLDDCLSAVDSHTAKHIFDEALNGNLMFGRTCILVSHNVALTIPSASLVVVLANGKIVAQGTPDEVLDTKVLGEDILRSRPTSKLPSPVPSRSGSNFEETGTHLSGSKSQPDGHVDASEPGKDKKFVDTRIESKATGNIKLATIKSYLRSMGPWYYWIFAGFGFVAVQLGSIATNVWIREWANAYSTRRTQHAFHHSHFQSMATHSHALSGGLRVMSPVMGYHETRTSDSATSDNVDAAYYLGIYALLGTVYVLLCFGREIILFLGSLKASWALHDRLLNSILRATFRFFDSTPLGQLTNRFSKDIQSIDQEVAPVAIGMFHSAAAVATIVILITSITPGFLIPGFFIACMYIATGYFYVRSSRALKRIEAVQRSPLFQHFGETLSGVVTIRAYGDEARFLHDSHTRVNTHNRPFIYLWATNRWLALRMDVSGAFVSFFSAAFVVMNAGKIDAGAAGLSLSYAITFTQNVLWLVRLYAANEQNMNAVERVQEYIDVEQEAPAQVPENKPPANWPSHGVVEFINYGTRYRKDLEFVLKNLTFKIQAGEKVGIVGRTGAGKSSLALALFRGLEAEEGKILIDSTDIGLIGLRDLREAITIVPQDPTLFSGTLRNNLDPFELFTDEEIFTALRRVQLISSNYDGSQRSSSASRSDPSGASTLGDDLPRTENGKASSAANTVSSSATLVRFHSNVKENQNVFLNLSSPIAESGSNLSQGQRQLLCLARALLKSPKVLVMDEATASIDYATDSKIQDTLRELKNNTIVTIAHRLQTIIDYDKVLVLDKGELVEFADPWELIRKEDGVFRGMCETSGDMDILMNLAKEAWEARRLVDDS